MFILLKNQPLLLVVMLLIVPGCMNREKKDKGDMATTEGITSALAPIEDTDTIIPLPDWKEAYPDPLDGRIEVMKDGANSDIYIVVEEQPEFPDGLSAMMKWLKEHISYPAVAQEGRIQGRVIVNFVVEKDGSISNVQVVRGVDPSLDKEAVRVVESMPNWKPGKHKGENARVRFTLPVSFRLSGDDDVKRVLETDIKLE